MILSGSTRLVVMNSELAPRKATLKDRARSSVFNRLRAQPTKLGDERVTAAQKRYVVSLFHVVILIAAFLIVFSRRPDAILNAQFFAEDGPRWYADAYQFGVRSLL